MRKVAKLPAVGTSHALTPTLSQRERGSLVELGGYVFSSTITGADPVTGELSPDPKAQAIAAFQNLGRLLELAAMSPDDIGLLRVAVAPERGAEGYRADAYITEPANQVFGRTVAPSGRIDVYSLPAGELVQLQVIGMRGEPRQQVTLPFPFARAARTGPMLFSSGILGIDPSSGGMPEDRRMQISQAFGNMETVVRQAGGSMDDIAHVFIHVRGRGDNDDVLEGFLDAFPTDGDRPARKNVYDDQLSGMGTAAILQMIAVLGQGRRQNYEVPGAAKKHPNPLGTRIGNLLFSAGIGGQDPAGREVERQAARALDNVRALMEQAGGSLDDIAHVTFTVDDYAHTPIIEQEWRKLFPDPATEPARHIMAFGGRDGSYQIQVHTIAVLGSGS